MPCSVVVVPYRIAFAVDAKGAAFAFDVLVDLLFFAGTIHHTLCPIHYTNRRAVVDLLFFADMVLCSVTAYADVDSGVLVTDKAAIRRNYAKGERTR
jgi:hypothetical protein